MAYLQGRSIGQLLSSRINARVASTSLPQLQHLPHRSMRPSVRAYHQSSSAQDKASSPAQSPSPRPQQNKEGDSYIWQRGKRKETRNRISTLALDPNAVTEAEASDMRQSSHEQRGSQDEGDASRRKSAGKIPNRKQRRILLLSIILLMPVIGRDIMEVIVPGVLGTVIFVGSKVKSAIKWVRRMGSGEQI